jgi:hypothetical protein
MATLRLTGHINTDGKLQVDLPPDVPPGEVEVIINMPEPARANPPLWTDEEIQQVMQVDPKTGSEIARMLDEMEPGFEHITDSAAWIEEQRCS